MSAGQYDFSIEQGTSFGLSIKYADSGNVPVDLSVFSCAKMQWNTDINTAYYFSTNNTNSGLYLFEFSSPLSSGIINLKIPASVTAGYNFINADYDLELETINDFYPGGGPQVIRLLEGTITIIPEITRISCSGI